MGTVQITVGDGAVIMKLVLILVFSSLTLADNTKIEEIPDEIESVLSEHRLDYDSESVGLIVDIALTLYEGLVEYTKQNIEAEKITFKPRIDSFENEEEFINGENEVENLSNHRSRIYPIENEEESIN